MLVKVSRLYFRQAHRMHKKQTSASFKASLKLFVLCKICKCAKLKSVFVSLCFPGSSWMCQLPGVELDWKVSYTIPASFLVSFPDRIFRACRKNRSGELPIPFSLKVCQNASTLFFSNLMLDAIEECNPHCVPTIY